jgi:hypothetical protein
MSSFSCMLGLVTRYSLLGLGFWTMIARPLEAQIRPANQDESLVPAYTLADPLIGPDGKKITDRTDWPSHQKYLISLFANQVYGAMPNSAVEIKTELIEEGIYQKQLGDSTPVRRRQYAITLSRNSRSTRVDLIVWSPTDTTQSFPCFLGLNFRGNQSATEDPAVRITTSWCDARSPGVIDHRATEASRASQSDRWPIEDIVQRGYAVATVHYGDIDPDFDDSFENGVHALFPDHRCTEQTPHLWGSIGAWAWGLSRVADVLQKTDGIHPDKLMVVGHSRLGKTALWAGANDLRFKIVFSNNSGCGGAALSKRFFGESVAIINRAFPHWFNRNFRQYNDAESEMPFDQHQLIASLAPRPVYIASASQDGWADPLGELLAGHHASPAYALFGLKGLDASELPTTNQAIGNSIGYHLREGVHDLTPLDWSMFMDFANRHGL